MDILGKINWVDFVVLIVIARTSYVSLQDGLSHGILPLVGSVFMLVLSLYSYSRIAALLFSWGFALPMDVLNAFSFIMSVIAIGVLFKFISVTIDKIIKVSWNPVLEKFGGLAVGVVRGAVLASTILTIIVLLPLPYLQWSIRDRSLTGMYVLGIGPAIYGKTSTFMANAPVNSKEFMDNLVIDKSLYPTYNDQPAQK